MATKGFGTGDLNPTDRIVATSPIGSEGPKAPGAELAFQSFMERTPSNPLATPGMTTSMSPFDLAHGPTTVAVTPSFDTILTQVSSAQNALGGVQNQLSQPNLKLKQAQKYVVKNKLTDANSQIRSVNAKLGVENIAEAQSPSGSGPIQKFLALVSNGQVQLQSAKDQLQNLKHAGENLNAADMLQIQVKMNQAQLLVEFASVVLGKAVDDIKTIMNIQL